MPSDFEPEVHQISAITISEQAEVTTSTAHGFEDGSWVRIFVPDTYLMDIFFELTRITVLNTTSFRTTIDTSAQPTFTQPSAPYVIAQAIPVSQDLNNVGT